MPGFAATRPETERCPTSWSGLTLLVLVRSGRGVRGGGVAGVRAGERERRRREGHVLGRAAGAAARAAERNAMVRIDKVACPAANDRCVAA